MRVAISPEIKVVVNGQPHVGYYSFAEGLVTVASEFGVKTKPIGDLSAEQAAAALLSELVMYGPGQPIGKSR
jgi:hypothetical protein